MITQPHMKGEEFVRKILAGERDLHGVRLEEGFDLSGYEGFQRMNDYLKKQDLTESPVDLTNSEMKYVGARGLYLPFVKAEKADLWGAYLGGADLGRTDLREADLREANLRGVKNLEGVLYLEYAHFGETRVTEKERDVIERALKSR